MQRMTINVTPALCKRTNSAAGNSNHTVTSDSVSRWVLYKHLCIAKSEFNLNDRCLAVLSSLLSFLPQDHLSSLENPVVFPSNRQLSLRAHGMPESTLRRHLASLIKAGIITRIDSPNRKRYAHKDGSGAIEMAFGFSFRPMIARTQEIIQKSEETLARQRALKLLRDRVSITRREIAEEFLNCKRTAQIEDIFLRFRKIVDAIPRRATSIELTSIKSNLDSIADELSNALLNNDYVEKTSGTVAQFERHHSESLTESLSLVKIENLNDLKGNLPQINNPSCIQNTVLKPVDVSLDMVLRYCPDIRAYNTKPISCWRDLLDAANVVTSFLGITPSLYREASVVLGRQGVSAVVAWLLQRSSDIHSPGGYLRSLVQKATTDSFAITALFLPARSVNPYQRGT